MIPNFFFLSLMTHHFAKDFAVPYLQLNPSSASVSSSVKDESVWPSVRDHSASLSSLLLV